MDPVSRTLERIIGGILNCAMLLGLPLAVFVLALWSGELFHLIHAIVGEISVLALGVMPYLPRIIETAI